MFFLVLSMNMLPTQNIKDTIKLASKLFMTKCIFKVLSHDMVT